MREIVTTICPCGVTVRGKLVHYVRDCNYVSSCHHKSRKEDGDFFGMKGVYFRERFCTYYILYLSQKRKRRLLYSLNLKKSIDHIWFKNYMVNIYLANKLSLFAYFENNNWSYLTWICWKPQRKLWNRYIILMAECKTSVPRVLMHCRYFKG